jgi:hypothetical protein
VWGEERLWVVNELRTMGSEGANCTTMVRRNSFNEVISEKLL